MPRLETKYREENQRIKPKEEVEAEIETQAVIV